VTSISRRTAIKTAGTIAAAATLARSRDARADSLIHNWHDLGTTPLSADPSAVFGTWNHVWGRTANGSPWAADFAHDQGGGTTLPGTLAAGAIVASDVGGLGGVARFSDGTLKSTSQGPNGNWFPWLEVGGGRSYQTDPCAWGRHPGAGNPMSGFAAQASDNTVWVRNSNDTWSSLGRFNYGAYGLAAALSGPTNNERIDLFVALGNGVLYRATKPSATAAWQYWWGEMGPNQGVPSAVNAGDGTLRILARSTTNVLVCRTLNLSNPGASTTQTLGDTLYADPYAVASPGGRVDVFFRGLAGIYQRTLRNGSWQPAVFWGGNPFNAAGNTFAAHRPVAVYGMEWWPQQRELFDVFVRGSNEKVWHLAIQRT
jgi:hypothetical protein